MKRWLIVILAAGASFVVTLIIVAAIEQRDVNLKKGAASPATARVPYPYQAALKLAVEKRQRYRDELDKVFLKSGINISVWLEDETTTYDGLRLLGPLSRPSVYNIATAMSNLDAPRQLGFKSVEFNSTIGEGKWKFNTDRSPTCDRDLCF